jgi:hypothetical protein
MNKTKLIQLLGITFILATLIAVSLLIVEIFFPFRPTPSDAVLEVKRYSGGVNPWTSAEIVTVIAALPNRTTVFVDYTNAQQRCFAAHHVAQRLISGAGVNGVETVCDPVRLSTTFEVYQGIYDNLSLLMGFSLDDDVEYVRAKWSDGLTQETIIEDRRFLFWREGNGHKIEHIIGLDAQKDVITPSFSFPGMTYSRKCQARGCRSYE